MQGMRSINTARSPGTPRGDHTSPTIDQLLHDDCSNGSCSSPLSKEHDQEDPIDHHQHKKSVLTKVKEKAKKLKHSLSKKKHSHEDTGSPSSVVSLDEEENDSNAPEYLKAPSNKDLHISCSTVALEDEENDDIAPEYLGAPMYESEQAPEACKETIKQQPRAVPIVSEKHIVTNNVTDENKNLENDMMNEHKAEKVQMNENNDMVTEADEGVVSRGFYIQNFEMGGGNTWDKGVSVKEYLRQTLEPGENDRALSQVITEAMSPRKTYGHEIGVVNMFKEAVTSLVHPEETTSQSTIVSSSPSIPISTYPQQVTEEENHGRILQSN